MRTFEEIDTIICNLEENLYTRLTESEYDALALVEDRNAQARFNRLLKKAGLTKEEWQQWSRAI